MLARSQPDTKLYLKGARPTILGRSTTFWARGKGQKARAMRVCFLDLSGVVPSMSTWRVFRHEDVQLRNNSLGYCWYSKSLRRDLRLHSTFGNCAALAVSQGARGPLGTRSKAFCPPTSTRAPHISLRSKSTGSLNYQQTKGKSHCGHCPPIYWSPENNGA
jgi:hypothetical protein